MSLKNKKTDVILIIAIIIIILITLLLVGYRIFSNNDIQGGLVELKMDSIGKYTDNLSMDVLGDLLLVLNLETDSDEYEMEIWDLTQNKCTAKTNLENTNLEEIIGAEFLSNSQIALYSGPYESGKAEIYNLNLEHVGNVDNYISSLGNSGKQEKIENNEFTNIDSDFIDMGSFAIYNQYFSGEEYEQAVVFYSDTNSTYFGDLDTNLLDSIDKTMFYSEEKADEIELTVKDYESATIINTAKIDIPKIRNGRRVMSCAVNEKYLCVTVYPATEDENLKIYYWDYTKEQTNTPFEVNRMTQNEIEQEISEISKQMKQDWDLDIYFNNLPSDYEAEETKLSTKKYIALRGIQDTLKLFPEGMFQEMKNTEFDAFQIYIANDILNEDIGGYTSTLFHDEEGYLYIVYSIDDLSQSSIAHEMMHAAEYRINQIIENSNGNWEKLNPNGFTYEPDNYEEVYFSNDEYYKYFSTRIWNERYS